MSVSILAHSNICKSKQKALLGKPSYISKTMQWHWVLCFCLCKYDLSPYGYLIRWGMHCTHLMQNNSRNFTYQILNGIYETQTVSPGPNKSFLFLNSETILPSSQPLIEMKMFYIIAFAQFTSPAQILYMVSLRYYSIEQILNSAE